MANIQMLYKDRMELLSRYPDNYFNIAILDPEYGIGEDGKKNLSRGNKTVTQRNGSKVAVPPTLYTPKSWDSAPAPQELFDEIFRVSQHQIIWGANYFLDKIRKPTSGIIAWDKLNGASDQSDFELAWTSFKTGARIFRFMWNGFQQGKSMTQGHIQQGNKKLNEKRRHPTQKPRALYKWCYEQFCQPDWKVLDTGFGSGNSAIEAFFFLSEKGEYVGCDNDLEYYESAVAEFQRVTAPLPIFLT